MRRLIQLFLVLIGLCAMMASCTEIVGNGEVITQEANAAGFTKIRISVPAEVWYTVSDNFALEIRGESNIVQDIEYEIEQEELHIKFADDINFQYKPTVPLVINVSAPQLNKILLSKASKFSTKDRIIAGGFSIRASGASFVNIPNIGASKLSIHLSGASEAHLGQLSGSTADIRTTGSSQLIVDHLEMASLNVRSSGASNIEIKKGNVNKQVVNLSGSSDYIAPHLITKTTTIDCSGASTADIHVEQALDAELSGSSTLNYSGKPMTSSILGSKSAKVKNKPLLPQRDSIRPHNPMSQNQDDTTQVSW